ncbi:MAG: hypothetical protein HY675_21350 [Chloroflexi bacterium]|nr:hypothetical protein [Chloroflexota bacterium]
MSDIGLVRPVTPEALTLARELAREMASAKVQMLRFYQERDTMTVAEAEVKAAGRNDVDWHERTKNAPAQQVDWWGLNALAEADPDAAQAVWGRIAAEARDELESGDRAAKALESCGSPWERAQFLVLRCAFREEWRPRGGIEAALVDTLTQAHSAYLFWLNRLRWLNSVEAIREQACVDREGKWTAPTVSHVEAVEQSGAMVDRFNRLFLRTLRALRDLRRYSPAVVIQNAGQVNLAAGGGQQVNVADSGGETIAGNEALVPRRAP